MEKEPAMEGELTPEPQRELQTTEQKGAIGIALLVWLFGGGLGLALLVFILLKMF